MAETQRDAQQRRRRQIIHWVIWFATLMALNITFTELIHRGILTLPRLLAIGVVFVPLVVLTVRYVIIPRQSHRAPIFPRIERADEWEVPAPQAQTLHRIEELLQQDEWRTTSEDGVLRAVCGSDTVFRFRGSWSRKGWAALPLAATFHVTSEGTDSRVVADVRDDLGWYPVEPQEFVVTEINQRAATLIRRAREATKHLTTDH